MGFQKTSPAAPRWFLSLIAASAIAGFTACGPAGDDVGSGITGSASAPDLSVPRWAQEAIWYQIFPERFANGDPSNDPTLHDMEGSWPPIQPEGWAPTPWGWDWYAQEDWAVATGEPFYTTVQLRRYGGDLQGVIDRLDYLEELGITAIYINPVNDSPSLHKYGARHYRHIDRNFGPDPRGDEALAASEDPLDPATWVFTTADSLFLSLIDEVHARGMRIIVDYSWNHTGDRFWAWMDLVENQTESRFADWYEVESFDDPATDEDEFVFSGWAGVRDLPELKKVGRPEGETHGAIEGTLHPEVRDHVFNVTRRWMDPNGDGDPSDGVDGFRLDVAEIVPLGFWREYRTFVRSINPEAYLVGEVWWEQWPERMYDPAPWLQGDVFDAVMNYRWYKPTRGFLSDAPPELTPSAYMEELARIEEGFAEDHVKAQMNLVGSHDSPRVATSLYNPGVYKSGVSGSNPDYRIDRPDARTRRIQEMVLAQQFTWVGAPHIWYGDEVGMWGPDDPGPRKPMVWPDLEYEDEASDPLGRPREADPVAPDLELLEVYRTLIALRKENVDLFVDGVVNVLAADDQSGLLAYERVLGEGQNAARAVLAFNRTDAPMDVRLEVPRGEYQLTFASGGGVFVESLSAEGALTATLPPLTAAIWVRR